MTIDEAMIAVYEVEHAEPEEESVTFEPDPDNDGPSDVEILATVKADEVYGRRRRT